MTPATLGVRAAMRDVVVYLDQAPNPQSSGASLRFYSNCRAWADLGARLHIAVAGAPGPIRWPDDIPVSSLQSFEPARARGAGLLARVNYRLGRATAASRDFYFPSMTAARTAVAEMTRRFPSAWHFFEHEQFALAASEAGAAHGIWSQHDSLIGVVSATHRISDQLGGAGSTDSARRRELRFVKDLETRLARARVGIVCISDADRERYCTNWGRPDARYLPLAVNAPDSWTWQPSDGMPLRLLHLGAVAHLPTFTSLEFLLKEVWPRLPPDVSARVCLDVVGRRDGATARVRYIERLAERFGNVRLHGFAESLNDFYARSHLQVVASTDATGLRTRVLESLAHGVPVLATGIAVAGIRGLEDGREVLIADDVDAMVAAIEATLLRPGKLRDLSAAGREFVAARHSRAAVSVALAEILDDLRGEAAG